MRIERVWAMPNKRTFTIEPIETLFDLTAGEASPIKDDSPLPKPFFNLKVENVRSTSQKEILKARVFSAELITKDLLSPIDNLTRALQHSEEEIPRSLIELVLKEISQALSNNNVEEIDPLGINLILIFMRLCR